MLDRDRSVIRGYQRTLEQDEQYRGDPTQWHQWNAEHWERTLAQLTDAAAQRDDRWRAAIDPAASSSLRQTYIRQFLQDIETERTWLQQRIKTLDELARSGRRIGPNGSGRTEISRHQQLLNLQLRVWQARHAEVTVEQIELQQRGASRIDAAPWNRAWKELEEAWAEHEAFAQRRGGDRRQRVMHRRAWLERLYAIQEATFKAAPQGAKGALHVQMALVQQAISANPLPQQAGGGEWGILAAVLLVIILAAGAATGATRTSSEAQPAPLVPLAGEAQPAPLVPVNPTTDSGSGVNPKPVALEPLAAPTLIILGQEARRTGRYVEAVSYFEQAIAHEPALSASHTELAFCLFDLGHTDEAILRWEEAVRLTPSDPDALAGLGMALYGRGEQDMGLARYQEATRIDPRYGDEDFLQIERAWSEGAIVASRPLRAARAP